jgi:hypothetical protein
VKTQLLYLDAHDDMASTLEKLRWVQADHVVLVWPTHGRILHRRVDLVLLAREAQRRAALLGILSHDPDVRAIARQLELPIFDDLTAVSRQPWPDRPPAPPGPRLREPRALPPLPPRDRAEANPAGSDAQRAISMMFVIVALLALSIAVGPAAIIELTPVEQEESLSLPVSFGESSGASVRAITAPGRNLQWRVEGKIQIPTEGRVQVPVSAATGAVTFTNRSDEEVVVPEGTGLRTLGPQPQRFETTERSLVPAGIGNEVVVPLRASAAGPAGNVSAGSIGAIEGPLGLTLTVTNLEETSGGRSETRRGVSENDLRVARESLERQLLQTANAGLQEQLDGAEALVPESVILSDVLSYEVRPRQGEPSEIVQAEMAARVTAAAFDLDRLRREAEAAMAEALGPGRELVPDSLRIELAANGAGTEARYTATVRALSRPSVDLATLAGSIAGRTTEEAAGQIEAQLDLAAPPRFRLWPAWWPRVPFLPMRVQPVWLHPPT